MTDPYGAFATLQKTITVNEEPNTAPTAAWQAGAPVAFTVPNNGTHSLTIVEVLLKGVETDTDGDVLTSQWVCGNQAVSKSGPGAEV